MPKPTKTRSCFQQLKKTFKHLLCSMPGFNSFFLGAVQSRLERPQCQSPVIAHPAHRSTFPAYGSAPEYTSPNPARDLLLVPPEYIPPACIPYTIEGAITDEIFVIEVKGGRIEGTRSPGFVRVRDVLRDGAHVSRISYRGEPVGEYCVPLGYATSPSKKGLREDGRAFLIVHDRVGKVRMD